MSTVYIIQQNRMLDFSPAMVFGDIRIILPQGDANFEVEDTVERLVNGLFLFDPDTDYIVANGDPIAIAIAFNVLQISCHDETVKVLKWNKKTSDYIPVELRMGEVFEKLQKKGHDILKGTV